MSKHFRILSAAILFAGATSFLGLYTWSSMVVAAEQVPESSLVSQLEDDHGSVPDDQNSEVPRKQRPMEGVAPNPIVIVGELPNEKRIRDIVTTETTELDFAAWEPPLREALAYIGDAHNLKIYIDEQALLDENIDADAPVRLSVSNVTLASALNLILEPMQLAYVVEDEVLKITTQTVLSSDRKTRVYDVRPLYDASIGTIEVVQSIVEPGSWNDEEGAGNVVYLEDAVVMITHNSRVHKEIHALFGQLSMVRSAVEQDEFEADSQ